MMYPTIYDATENDVIYVFDRYGIDYMRKREKDSDVGLKCTSSTGRSLSSPLRLRFATNDAEAQARHRLILKSLVNLTLKA